MKTRSFLLFFLSKPNSDAVRSKSSCNEDALREEDVRTREQREAEVDRPAGERGMKHTKRKKMVWSSKEKSD